MSATTAIVCDCCGAAIPERTDGPNPYEGRAALRLAFGSDWAAFDRMRDWHFCTSEDGDDCFGRALAALRAVCSPLEQIPTASAQKITALRRRHVKEA